MGAGLVAGRGWGNFAGSAMALPGTISADAATNSKRTRIAFSRPRTAGN